ncbi:MAG: PDZ domain-containing protein [Puia sp.]|nr:PDZ domain-containing protein [Puia sp.]
MNKHFFAGIAGAAVLALLLHPGVFAQSMDSLKNENPGIGGNAGRPGLSGEFDKPGQPEDPDKLGEYDEIVIKRKDGKNARVTIEFRDDKVFADGKPVSRYESDTLSVRKKRIRVVEGRGLSFGGPGGGSGEMAPPSLFRGQGGVWNFRQGNGQENANRALLGVYSGKNEADGGGAVIKEITPGSAAEKAGLQKGDVITRVDEIKIGGPDDLYDAIHQYKPGDKVTITCQRVGKEQKVSVILGAGKSRSGRPNPDKLPGPGNIDLGNLDLRNLPIPPGTMGTPDGPNFPDNSFGWFRNERPRLGIHAQDTEDGKGAKVLEVDKGSPAEKAGLKEGDIITRFDGKEIKDAASLAAVAREDKDKAAMKIGLQRNGAGRELEIKVPKRLKTADL